MSELIDAGFNPAAVSGREGHIVQVMLHHYSTRRQSSDKAAAEHLGQRIHGCSDKYVRGLALGIGTPSETGTRPPQSRCPSTGGNSTRVSRGE
jgi:hypothetical protein